MTRLKHIGVFMPWIKPDVLFCRACSAGSSHSAVTYPCVSVKEKE